MRTAAKCSLFAMYTTHSLWYNEFMTLYQAIQSATDRGYYVVIGPFKDLMTVKAMQKGGMKYDCYEITDWDLVPENEREPVLVAALNRITKHYGR